jgi:outer membrane immunogenic protein
VLLSRHIARLRALLAWHSFFGGVHNFEVEMRKFLMVSAAMLVGGSAVAADLTPRPLYKAAPYVPRFSWTGTYIGFSAGYGWENTQTQYGYTSGPAAAPPGFQDVFGPGGPLNVGGTPAVSSALAQGFIPNSLGNRHYGSFAAAGEAGYNYQIDTYVIGLETDFGWVGGTRTTSFTAPPNVIGLTNNSSSTAGLDWLGTVRGRVGLAYDRALFFATGGLAYGQAKASSNSAVNDGTNTDLYSGSVSGIRTGYAVGGGIEYAITNNLSVKAEYLYYNLGSATYAVAPANTFAAGEGLSTVAHQKFDGSVVRAGLNYKVDWFGGRY